MLYKRLYHNEAGGKINPTHARSAEWGYKGKGIIDPSKGRRCFFIAHKRFRH